MRFLQKYTKQHTKDPFIRTSTFIKYETENDKSKITFETYRVIQCKSLIMTYFPYNFKWTGTKEPKITSKLQIVGKNKSSRGQEEYDSVQLEFKDPLRYNENAVVHFHAELDDVDGISEPYTECRVDEPISIIHFRIILKYKKSTFNESAFLWRKKINSMIGAGYERIESIQFKGGCKSYEYHLVNPEIGYYYKIEWKK